MILIGKSMVPLSDEPIYIGERQVGAVRAGNAWPTEAASITGNHVYPRSHWHDIRGVDICDWLDWLALYTNLGNVVADIKSRYALILDQFHYGFLATGNNYATGRLVLQRGGYLRRSDTSLSDALHIVPHERSGSVLYDGAAAIGETTVFIHNTPGLFANMFSAAKEYFYLYSLSTLTDEGTNIIDIVYDSTSAVTRRNQTYQKTGIIPELHNHTITFQVPADPTFGTLPYKYSSAAPTSLFRNAIYYNIYIDRETDTMTVGAAV